MSQTTKNPAAAAVTPQDALLDAAERLLVGEGHAAVTTRRVATEAGLNHGLIHYYFGSMEELMIQVLERFTGRLIERQRELYARDIPFIEKWRGAMAHLETDRSSGYQKIWLELQALAWNRPHLRGRVAGVHGEWRAVLTDAFRRAAAEYGLDEEDFSIPALVSLVMTFNEGIILEGLCGITDGHGELLDWIAGWLQEREGAPR